ncbi:putative quinol monooxygenase [Parasphingorhabdus sp.]|uniref:putative quinol monooxygenase n=1 Tax=Parasphingorhabdus sp. TaxID=2709688 RepID=UPI002F95F007
MSELFIVVGLKTTAGREDELRRDLSVLVEPSRNEDGNVLSDLFEDKAEPGRFAFIEAWSPWVANCSTAVGVNTGPQSLPFLREPNST